MSKTFGWFWKVAKYWKIKTYWLQWRNLKRSALPKHEIYIDVHIDKQQNNRMFKFASTFNKSLKWSFGFPCRREKGKVLQQDVKNGEKSSRGSDGRAKGVLWGFWSRAAYFLVFREDWAPVPKMQLLRLSVEIQKYNSCLLCLLSKFPNILNRNPSFVPFKSWLYWH